MPDRPNNPTGQKTDELGDAGQEEGYEDTEPISPDENPGDASKDLNEEAAKAYAEAGSDDHVEVDSKKRAAAKSQAATARADRKAAKAEEHPQAQRATAKH